MSVHLSVRPCVNTSIDDFDFFRRADVLLEHILDRTRGFKPEVPEEKPPAQQQKHAADNKPELSQIAAPGRELLEVGNRECPVFV